MSHLVLGIDEAGRGPALGPMVLAAVALAPSSARRLSRAGVADSKQFGAGEQAHARRTELALEVRAHAAHVAFEVCDVHTIDRYVTRGALNLLERERAAILIAGAPPSKRIVADGKRLFAQLRGRYPHLEARDHGESHHVAVAAASIVAKVERDRLFLEMAARYVADFGPIRGLGYSNAGTRAFALAYQARHGCLPPEARLTWPWLGIPRETVVASRAARADFSSWPGQLGLAFDLAGPDPVLDPTGADDEVGLAGRAGSPSVHAAEDR